MARNEEKQLARLNRLYLQQQKEEELKKRPPRPKLETLSSVSDIKKWLPTIMRDIDYYVKQMEVPCYPKNQIEEFERCIDHLRGEYKAFLRKMRQLDPDLETTPWSDRPYRGKHKKLNFCTTQEKCRNDTSTTEEPSSDGAGQSASTSHQSFIPLFTPILRTDTFYKHFYGYEKPQMPVINDVDSLTQNEPLEFDYENRSFDSVEKTTDAASVYRGHEDSGQVDTKSESSGSVISCVFDSEHQHVHGDKCNQETRSVAEVAAENSKRNKLPNYGMSSSKESEISKSCATHIHRRESEELNKIFCGDKCECDKVNKNKKLRGKFILSKDEESSGVLVHGTLNIPYTDSSSSDTET